MSGDGSDVRAFDFRKPNRPAGTEESLFSEWHENFCGLLAEKLAEHVKFLVSFSFDNIAICQAGNVIAGFSDSDVAYYVYLDDVPNASMFVLPRRYLLAIANGMLGDDSKEEIEDRPLTGVEKSLADLTLEIFLEAMSQAFLGSQPLPCHLGDYEDTPKRSRNFARDSSVIVSKIKATLPCGAYCFVWMIPITASESISFPNDQKEPASTDGQTVTRESLEDVQLELSVGLGSIEAHMSDLANLKVGDVLVLDQRVGEPLVASVDGMPCFQVWPGSSGSRRAVKVADVIGR